MFAMLFFVVMQDANIPRLIATTNRPKIEPQIIVARGRTVHDMHEVSIGAFKCRILSVLGPIQQKTGYVIKGNAVDFGPPGRACLKAWLRTRPDLKVKLFPKSSSKR